MDSETRGIVLGIFIVCLLLGGLGFTAKSCNDSDNAAITACVQAGQDPMHCAAAVGRGR